MKVKSEARTGDPFDANSAEGLPPSVRLPFHAYRIVDDARELISVPATWHSDPRTYALDGDGGEVDALDASAESYCAVGALQRAYDDYWGWAGGCEYETDRSVRDKSWGRVIDAVAARCPDLPTRGRGGSNEWALQDWNDAQESHREVLSVFDGALADLGGEAVAAADAASAVASTG